MAAQLHHRVYGPWSPWNVRTEIKKEDHMKLVLTSATFLTIIATPALAQTHHPNGPREQNQRSRSL